MKSNLLKGAVYFMCILLLIAPFSEVFYPIGEGDGAWRSKYAYNSTTYAGIVFPIVGLLLIIPKIKSPKMKKLSIIALIVFSLFAFIVAIMSFSFPIQDFSPKWGLLVFLFLIPIVIIQSFVEWKKTCAR